MYFGILHDVDILRDVKIVFVCGSRGRAKLIAERASKELQGGAEIKRPLIWKERDKFDEEAWFDFYQVGEVVVCSHGMGTESVDAFIEGLFPLLKKAGACPVVFRIGSSGGIGAEGGTQIVANRALNGYGRPEYEISVCGKKKILNCDMDQKLAKQIADCSSHCDFNVVLGATVCGRTYYEGQARLDGSICEYTNDEKLQYLKRLHAKGVRNFEMEGVMLSASCNLFGFPFAMVAASYLDRLQRDSSAEGTTAEDFARWAKNSIDVAFNYAQKYLFEESILCAGGVKSENAI